MGAFKMIISFAWTTPAFIAGRKTVTRREWTLQHASHFLAGSVHDAWDKSPRFGGKPIGKLRIISIAKTPICKMPNSDYEAEGFAFLEEKGLKIWKKHPKQAFEDWRAAGGIYWEVRFEKI